MERVKSFKTHAEKFFQHFKSSCPGMSTGRKPYLHILREHVGEFMEFWAEIGWGYGFFNCNGGEHLNKCIKNLELHNTNFDDGRFKTIMRHLRVKQFHYPESIFSSAEKNMTCSRCKEKGHIKKNKNCRLHPDQPSPHIDDSDNE
eukprot:TCONS_00031050-protein